MTDTRVFPDINFVDTDTNTIVKRVIQKLENRLNRTLYPADPLRLLALWLADIEVQLLINIDYSAKQNIPRYAEGDYLESLMELFKDVRRLDPVGAKTTLRFRLATTSKIETVIKSGTRVAVDDEIIFETVEKLVIPPCKLEGYVTAVCKKDGEVGNDFLPGQINQMIGDSSLFESVENVTKSEGGAEQESDAALYLRSRESFKTYSTAGAVGAYEYYAKTASARIIDAVAQTTEPGVVEVGVLEKGGKLPGKELLLDVEAVLSSSSVRPLTDCVKVVEPRAVPYNINFTYYVDNESDNSDEIKNVVKDAVNDFIIWQSGQMGRDINPSQLNYRLMQTGIQRVEIKEPIFTKVASNAVAVFEEKIIYRNGEVEKDGVE